MTVKELCLVEVGSIGCVDGANLVDKGCRPVEISGERIHVLAPVFSRISALGGTYIPAVTGLSAARILPIPYRVYYGMIDHLYLYMERHRPARGKQSSHSFSPLSVPESERAFARELPLST